MLRQWETDCDVWVFTHSNYLVMQFLLFMPEYPGTNTGKVHTVLEGHFFLLVNTLICDHQLVHEIDYESKEASAVNDGIYLLFVSHDCTQYFLPLHLLTR